MLACITLGMAGLWVVSSFGDVSKVGSSFEKGVGYKVGDGAKIHFSMGCGFLKCL